MSSKAEIAKLTKETLEATIMEACRVDPMYWLENRFGEPATYFEWSKLEGYEGHEWDGDIDPLANAWRTLGEAYRQVRDGETPTFRNVGIESATGCHAKGTLIMKFNGDLVPVEDIKVGDLLMGDDGKKRTVLELVRGRGKMAKIIPLRGSGCEPYVVNLDHILSLKYRFNDSAKYVVRNITVKQYIKLNKWAKLRYYAYHSNIQDFNCSQDHAPIHPYNLGFDSANEDEPMGKAACTVNRSDRFEILAGFIDSRGELTKLGEGYEIKLDNFELAKQVQFIAKSLGFKSSIYKKNRLSKHSYVSVRGERLDLIFTRKESLKITRSNKTARSTNYRFKVEELPEEQDYYGFNISGNKLYTMGNFTVTHNCSKTFMLARLTFWFLDCFPNSLVVTTAPKQDQLKLGLWAEIGMIRNKIKKLHPDSQFYKLRLAMKDDDPNDKSKEVDLDEDALANSWHAIGFVAGTGANEDSATKARGFHRKYMLIILEECTGISSSIINAFQNTSVGLTNFILALGNPDNQHDPLHQFCEQKDVKNFRISAFDYPNIVLQKELYSGAVTQASIDARTTNYGKGSPLWNAMVRGLAPAQAKDSLIKDEWIAKCIDLDLSDAIDMSYNAVGVDVANSKSGDMAGVAYGERATLTDLYEFACPNATHLAYNLFMGDIELELMNYDNYEIPTVQEKKVDIGCIGVDSVGIGVATVNTLNDNYYELQPLAGGQWDEVIPTVTRWHNGKEVSVPMFKFASLRAQMFWELREDLRNRKMSIKLDDKNMLLKLRKQLCVMRYKVQKSTIIVEPKEEIKKRLAGESPTLADIVAYWNWTRKGYRLQGGFMLPIHGGN